MAIASVVLKRLFIYNYLTIRSNYMTIRSNYMTIRSNYMTIWSA